MLRQNKNDWSRLYIALSIRRCADAVAPYFFIIFNKPLLEWSLLGDWKVAYVIPVHKKKSTEDVNNYRRIYLTFVCGKPLEHILYIQIM